MFEPMASTKAALAFFIRIGPFKPACGRQPKVVVVLEPVVVVVVAVLDVVVDSVVLVRVSVTVVEEAVVVVVAVVLETVREVVVEDTVVVVVDVSSKFIALIFSPFTFTSNAVSLTASCAADASTGDFTTRVTITLPHSALGVPIISSLFNAPASTKLRTTSFATSSISTLVQSTSSTIFTSVGTMVVVVETDVVVAVSLVVLDVTDVEETVVVEVIVVEVVTVVVEDVCVVELSVTVVVLDTVVVEDVCDDVVLDTDVVVVVDVSVDVEQSGIAMKCCQPTLLAKGSVETFKSTEFPKRHTVLLARNEKETQPCVDCKHNSEHSAAVKTPFTCSRVNLALSLNPLTCW